MNEFNERSTVDVRAELLKVYHLQEHHLRKPAKQYTYEPSQESIFAEPVTASKTQYRNAKCDCGSGKKFKNCCR